MVAMLLSSEKAVSAREWGMAAAMVLVVGFALFLAFKRFRSLKEDLPAEDEMSKKILRRGAATSFYLSLYSWLFLYAFADKIKLETHSLLGLGIMGMAVIFALSWIYHRFISRTYD
jgi:peptidoglycan/LPS O-acetylase OafA/YrhL